jgi:AcrR family transcriptional regulator
MAGTKSAIRGGAEARARILEAAQAVFTERGFHGATIDAIAKRSGLSRAGLLHHFAGKEELLLALLDARDAEFGLESGHWVDEGESATELLSSLPSRMDDILARRGLVALAHALSAEAAEPGHPAHEWLVTRYARLRDHLTEAFEISIARGELDGTVPPNVLASMWLATVEGLEAQWLADPDAVSVKDGMRALQKLILGGVSTGSTSEAGTSAGSPN